MTSRPRRKAAYSSLSVTSGLLGSNLPHERHGLGLDHHADTGPDGHARLDAEAWNAAEELFHGDNQLAPRQRGADTAVWAGGEGDVARIAVEQHLVRPLERLRIAIG